MHSRWLAGYRSWMVRACSGVSCNISASSANTLERNTHSVTVAKNWVYKKNCHKNYKKIKTFNIFVGFWRNWTLYQLKKISLKKFTFLRNFKRERITSNWVHTSRYCPPPFPPMARSGRIYPHTICRLFPCRRRIPLSCSWSWRG